MQRSVAGLMKAVGGGLAVVAAGVFTPNAEAVGISQGFSSADVVGSQVTSWKVNGIEQMGTGGASYYVRIGGGPNEILLSGASDETLISGLGVIDPPGLTLLGDNYNMTWGNSDVEIDFNVGITSIGGGLNPTLSTLPVDITVRAINAVDISIFEVHNLNLNSTAVDDTLDFIPTRVGGPPLPPRSKQTDGGTTTVFEGNSQAPVGVMFPTYVSLSDNPASLFALFGNGVADNMDDNTTPVNVADGAFAFQWDLSLAAGTSEDILLRKQIRTEEGRIIPEPVTSMLSLIGLVALGGSVTNRRR